MASAHDEHHRITHFQVLGERHVACHTMQEFALAAVLSCSGICTYVWASRKAFGSAFSMHVHCWKAKHCHVWNGRNSKAPASSV